MSDPQPAPPAADDLTPAQGSGRLHWGWWLGLALIVLGFTAIAIESVFHFEDSPLDGPFQLFNGLRRIAAGQRLGDDFQVFHGPGVPYLHYLPFLLFGGDFLASELSRQVVSISAAIAVLLAFFRAWTGSWRTAIPISVVALSALIPLRVNALLFPINSMIGLRSTMPIVIGIHLLLRGDSWKAVLERGVLIAIALACGIEQGMAAVAGLVGVHLIASARLRAIRPFARAAAAVAAGIACYSAIVFLMSPSGFASIMRFNFREVPGDQFWYFGGPPNPFFHRWMQLFTFFEHPVWTFFVIAVLVYAIRRFWRGAALPDARYRTAEAFLAIYAVISTASMLGTWNTVYFQPAVRVALFVGLIAIRRWWLTRRDTLAISAQLRRRAPAYAALAVIGYAVAGWPLATIAVLRTPLHMLYAHGLHGDRPTMTDDWNATAQVSQASFDFLRQRLGRTPVVWSTYASLLEYRAGVFHPSFDYIIHALGHENRQEYSRRFVESRPDLVQTLKPTYTMYEEWLNVHHWDFYRPLLRDYTMAAHGPWSYFWMRGTPTDEQPVLVGRGAVPPGQLGIAIDGRSVPGDSIGLFEVRLFYRADNPWRRVPVIGGLPRFMVNIYGAANHIPVSLPPYEREKAFPIVALGPSDIRLLGEVQSILGGASLVFDSIRVERLRLAPQNARWARDFIVGPPKDSIGRAAQ